MISFKLIETYDLLKEFEFRREIVANKLDISIANLRQRIKKLKDVGYEFPEDKNFHVSGMATNEERLRYYDFTANRRNNDD